MRVMRIELISSAWKADNLPLIYTRFHPCGSFLQKPHQVAQISRKGPLRYHLSRITADRSKKPPLIMVFDKESRKTGVEPATFGVTGQHSNH